MKSRSSVQFCLVKQGKVWIKGGKVIEMKTKGELYNENCLVLSFGDSLQMISSTLKLVVGEHVE